MSHKPSATTTATLVTVLALLAAACGATPIRYYQPVVVDELLADANATAQDCVLSVETFTSDAALDEQRIVYRESAHRFDYYHFHRWSAPPGELSSALLRESVRRVGSFRAVIGGLDPRAALVLSGRVVAFEEVDVDADDWQARVALELTLRNNHSGVVLWTELFEVDEPIAQRTPEGVAAAISRALTRIGKRLATKIAQEGSACGP